MSFEERMKDALRATLADDVSETPHIEAEQLASVAAGRHKLDEVAMTHLASCAECRDILGHAAQLETREEPSRAKWWWGLIPVVAAAAAAVVLVPRDDGFTSRGDTQALKSSVTVLITNSAGVVREAGAKDILHFGDRIGARYGNPEGFKTLTILAWDGNKVHWLYPASPSENRLALDSGSTALSRRLPEDVVIDSDFSVGPLLVVAAFDGDAAEMADVLKQGQTPPGATTVQSFEIVSAK